MVLARERPRDRVGYYGVNVRGLCTCRLVLENGEDSPNLNIEHSNECFLSFPPGLSTRQTKLRIVDKDISLPCGKCGRPLSQVLRPCLKSCLNSESKVACASAAKLITRNPHPPSTYNLNQRGKQKGGTSLSPTAIAIHSANLSSSLVKPHSLPRGTHNHYHSFQRRRHVALLGAARGRYRLSPVTPPLYPPTSHRHPLLQTRHAQEILVVKTLA